VTRRWQFALVSGALVLAACSGASHSRATSSISDSITTSQLVAAPTRATSVPLGLSLQDRDVYFRAPTDSGGHQLTSDGDILEAVISPDSSWIAFVRDTPGETISLGEDAPATELWVMRKDGSSQRRLVHGHDSPSPKHEVQFGVAGITGPSFAPGDTLIYFTSEAWVTSGAVHVVSVSSGAEHFVYDGQLEGVIQSGPQSGYLVIGRHMYSSAGSYSQDWYVAPNGQAVDSAGPREY
jgi:hypothetical protein